MQVNRHGATNATGAQRSASEPKKSADELPLSNSIVRLHPTFGLDFSNA